MNRILKFFLASALLVFSAGTVCAQNTYKVKKNETIYGIAHAHGITEAALRQANPEMNNPSYVLKKGAKIIIPSAQQPPTYQADDITRRTIRMGVMLPLHDRNGDGRRMVEYYRGLLMACDSLRQEGISVDIYAWNTPDDGDISQVLVTQEAAQCDIIFGPLYSRQMEQLSEFCQQHGSMLVIPFSIRAPQIATNNHIFQVYQAPEGLRESTARRMSEWFKDRHFVIVDCEDANSTEGPFTAALRQQLDSKKMSCSLTSMKTSSALFARAFSQERANLVVLNTSRTSDMSAIFAKLKELRQSNPSVRASVFGYTEWMSQVDKYLTDFHRYDVYIPSPFYTGLSPQVYLRLIGKYRSNFKQDMSSFVPPLAITGFDHAMYFLRGIHQYGKSFNGAAGLLSHTPVQTPLKFEHFPEGGYQNRAYMFVHYMSDSKVEAINY